MCFAILEKSYHHYNTGQEDSKIRTKAVTKKEEPSIMKSQTQNYRIYWEKTSAQSAKILRVFSNLPAVRIPEWLEGYPVTELGNYCFAPVCSIPENCFVFDTGHSDIVTEVYGNYLQSVELPESLAQIGDYTFYNCRNLAALTCFCGLQVIGSDAFMNCHNLHRIFLRCEPMEKNGLRRILAQIPWDIEVFFQGKSDTENSVSPHNEASVFYPEYYEAYDEIAPAHIFGRNIVGEGFRSRQCFQDGRMDFSQYDKIFPKACVEESVHTLCRIAFDRLRYPYQLSALCRQQYMDYLLTHGDILCRQFVLDKNSEDLMFLVREELLSRQAIQSAQILAAQTGWSEGSAQLLRFCQSQQRSHARTAYIFDDF